MNKYNESKRKKQACAEKMLEKIPDNIWEKLEYLMRKGGAITRERKIISGRQLLFFGLVLALGKLTYRELAYLGTKYQCCMSDTAWQKRIRKARKALYMILQYLLCILYPTPSPGETSFDVVDKTSFAISGSANQEIRLHVHLGGNGQMKEAVITDQHGAETLQNFKFKPGEAATGDRAYGKKKQLVALLEEGIPFLVRYSPRMITWIDEGGHKLDVYALLKENTMPFERSARLDENGPIVRLIFFPIPQSQWESIEKRRQRKMTKNQTRTPDDRAKLTNRWTLLATMLPESYDIEKIIRLYRLRWQIETYFKSLKQGLDFHQFRNCSIETAESILLLNLIAWMIAQYSSNVQYDSIREEHIRVRFSFYVVRKAAIKSLLDWVKSNIPLGRSSSSDPLSFLLDHKRFPPIHPPFP